MIKFYFELQPKTRQEVIDVIDSFSAAFEYSYGTIASGTFGHNVLDDYNLEDHSILWCLRNEHIQEWYKLRESELYPSDASGRIDPDDLRNLDRQRDNVIIFLRWLLTIDEEIRIWYEDEG